MVEKFFIKNPITLKRWRIFKSRKTGWFSLWAFIVLLFFALTAEFWANSKPLLLYYQNSFYIPIFKTYSPDEFGIEDKTLVNYKELKLGEKDFVMWPVISWDPYESNKELKKVPSAPSLKNLFGTDDRGRDVLSRLIYGYRYSIALSLVVWILTYFIGVVLGSLMGFFGGLFDLIGQRLTEIIESLPWLLILIMITTILGRSFWVLVFLFSLFSWMGISHYMRAEFLRLRKRPFVEASRSLGQSKGKIIFKHIFPNALTPIITFSPFALAGFISSLAILDYLGFGFMPPTPSWGELLRQSEAHIRTAWWLAVFPGMALFSSLLSLIFIGNALRDAFDPKQS